LLPETLYRARRDEIGGSSAFLAAHQYEWV
jgi:hypothetical protein